MPGRIEEAKRAIPQPVADCKPAPAAPVGASRAGAAAPAPPPRAGSLRKFNWLFGSASGYFGQCDGTVVASYTAVGWGGTFGSPGAIFGWPRDR